MQPTDPKFLYAESKMLERVITRGRQSDRSDIDAFVLTIREAHHLQGKPFFLDVLRNPELTDPLATGESETERGKWPDNVGGSWSDAKFHAAVALAELGEAEGVEWLLEKAKPNDFGIDGTVFAAPHYRVHTGSLRENCRYVLADLSGLQPAEEFDQWIAWWAANKINYRPGPYLFG